MYKFYQLNAKLIVFSNADQTPKSISKDTFFGMPAWFWFIN